MSSQLIYSHGNFDMIFSALIQNTDYTEKIYRHLRVIESVFLRAIVERLKT